MIVMPASSTLRAISLGVFWRTAPSTSAIMRSRKVEPWAAVILTLTQSDRTRVPPVTAERSPPLSRITGADSPVIADSSTEATPSTISPSLGIRSPASTSTRSPGLSSNGDTGSVVAALMSASRLATVSERVRRRLAAWALPRPSATASAKLANSTVIHSQAEIWPEKLAVSNLPAVPQNRSRTNRMVVTRATTSTTNMTGFLARLRGSSLRNESQQAGPRIDGSASEIWRARWVMTELSGSKEVAGGQREMLDDGAERERREEGQAADDQDHADQQEHEQR